MRDRFPALFHIRIWIFALAGGILFAAFDRCGYLLQNYGSLWVISQNPWHRTILMRILCRLPAYTLAVLVCLLLAERAALAGGGRKYSEKWERLGEKRGWFPALWALYFLSFLPAFLGGYPGLFAADAPNQVGWTFSGWLTAHHPLLHTGILCGIFSLTRALGLSDNTAAAAYTLLQMMALSGIFAWISRFLKKEKAPVCLQLGTVLFLCLFPFHGLMAVYTTKDTIFAGIFALCLMQIYRMCREPERYFQGFQGLLQGGLCFVLLILFRNNGFHTLLLCMPFLLAYLRRYWKKLLLLFGGVLLFYQIYNGPFLKFVGAEPGNKREAYSVVMQTLGRTYTAGGHILPEEMEVIRPVLDEETLGLYTPTLSDPVKNHFHTEAFLENQAEFLKTWAQIGLRNKKLYIDGALGTAAAFWYPWDQGEYLEFVCFDIAEGDPNYPHVQMRPISQACHRYYEAVGTEASFRQVPVLRELFSMGFYFWLLVFVSLYLIYAKKYSRLFWLLPLWTYMGTSLLGPAALLRYAYPLMLGAPLLLFWLWEE